MSSPISCTSWLRQTVAGDLEILEINHPGFSARLALQGGHLFHFAPTGDSNWLWLSPEAGFRQGRAIRGGIPICWPWFGDPDRNEPPVRNQVHSTVAHGFARSALWTLTNYKEHDDQVEVALTLETAAGSREDWSGAAVLEARFRFTPSGFTTDLTTRNSGTAPIALSQALHTYLPTDAIERTRVTGLEEVDYLDTLDGWNTRTQQGPVTFAGETDRIYLAAPTMSIVSPGWHLRLTASGSRSTVVWNPGPAKAATLSEFPDDAWRDMLCVETANAATDFRYLRPGASHTLGLALARN